MSNNSKYSSDSWDVFSRCYQHTCFPSDHVDDYAFQGRCAGLVRSWTDLISPLRSMTQSSTLSLSSEGSPVYYVTKGQSHSCNGGSPWRKSESSCSQAPLIPLINEHVQSTHCVSLKPDHINQVLNFKGQVPSLATWEKNMELLKQRTSHCTYTLTLIHLTPHFYLWTTHCIVSPRPHSRSHKADKRPRKTSQWALA